MNSREKIIPTFILLLMMNLSAFGYSGAVENDTIKPRLTNSPIDLIVGCRSDYIAELNDWLTIDGGALATDNSGEVSIETTLDAQTIEDSLANSFGTFCNPDNVFEIGFYALDTCGNTSIDTSFARFQIIDNERPVLENPAQSALVHCDASTQDSLNNWVRSLGGAIATDNCSPNVEWFRIIWNDNQGNSNTGHPIDGPLIPIDSENCNWSVTVSFFARDLCGNNQVTTASFSLRDTIAPTFINPVRTITIACDQVSENIAVEDNCNASLEATFEDISSTRSTDSTSCEYFNYSLERLWTVVDDCGNTSSFRQNIEVVDTIIPSFVVPPDITIFCRADIQPVVTGMPTSVVDNCNPDPMVIFSDSGSPEGCESVISRFWQIADGCGSSNIIPQQITVMDTISPMITQEAENLSLSCADPDSLVSQFEDWLGNIGGAMADDDCASLDWFAAVPGSYDINDSSTFPGELINSVDDLACGTSEVMVDFVFIDECNNGSATSASFTLIDSIAPVFEEPFEEIIIEVDTVCTPNVTMMFPQVSDNCLPDSQIVRQIRFEDRLIALSEARYDTLLPIGIHEFAYLIADCSGNIDSISSTITISDRISPTISCPEDIETQVDLTTCIAIVGLAVDSTVSDNCASPMLSYRVNGATNIDLDTITSFSDSLLLSLNAGDNLIEYFTSDDSGNSAECSFNVAVSDAGLQDIECKDETILLSISDPNPFLLVDTLFIENLVDNCFIDSISIAEDGRALTCDQVGDRVGTVITIFDRAGNSQNCTSIIVVGVETFDASYENNFCSSDTLKLFANVPLINDIDQNVYSWSGPNNYVSTVANPILTEVDASFSGEYVVSVTGEAGCSQIDTVQVSIETFESPMITSADTVTCLADSLSLAATSYEFEVIYNWFHGVFPDGNLIDTSSINTITFSTDSLSNDFYVIVEKDDCVSEPSNILSLQLVDVSAPMISCPQDTVISIDSLSCMANTILSLDYQATDDCGFDDNMIVDFQFEGNDVLVQDTLISDEQNIIEDLAIGDYQATYIVADKASNIDSCSYNISIVDNISPEIVCKSDSINLSIRQLNNFSVDDIDILVSADDNCALDTVLFSPNRIDCAIIGEQVNISIRAIDVAGNSSECTSSVQVMLDTLMINFTSGICPGDTLVLSSNIVDTTDLIFEWSGPNGFSSKEPMPMIINPTVQNNGSYMLSVGSDGSCSIDTETEIEVVEFVTPTIASSKTTLCAGDQVQLTTQNYGGNVTYSWFEGIAPNGELIAQESQPTFSYSPEFGQREIYVIVNNEMCNSDPSPSLALDVIDQPTVSVSSELIIVCEGETFNISVIDPNEDEVYEWIGPNDFSASTTEVNLTANDLTQGIYQVLSKIDECVSDTISVEVNLEPGGLQPIIEGQQQYCPGSTLRLVVSNIDSATMYSWFLADSTYTTSTSNVLEIDNINESLSGNWQVSVTGSCGGQLSEALLIEVLADLNVTAESNSPLCGASILELDVNEIEGATYNWEGPNGFTSDQRNPELEAFAGTYTVTVTANERCESVSTTEVELKELPSILSITSNVQPCADDITELRLTPSLSDNENISYEWTGPNDFSSTDEVAIVDDFSSTDEGVYTLRIFNGECESQPSNIVISTGGALSQPVIRASSEVCTGTSFTLSAENFTDEINEFIWSTPMGEITTDQPNLLIENASNNDSGIYTLSIKSGDCISEPSESVDVSVGSTVDAPQILSQGQFCNGETIQLEVDFQEGEYEWRGPNGFESENANPVIFNVNEMFEGAYEVRVTTDQCTSPWSEVFELELVDIPNTPIPQIADDILCRSDYAGDFELCVEASSAVDGARYNWINESTGDTLATSDERCFFLPSIEGLRLGRNNINVFTSLGNCFSDVSSRVTLTVTDGGGEVIDANAGADIFTCEDFVALDALLGDNERGAWSSPGDIDFGDRNDPKSTAMGLVQGENIFIWSVNGRACSAGSDTVSIFFGSDPVLSDDEFIFSNGQEIVFDPLSNDVLPSSFTFDIISIEGATGANAADPRAILLNVENGFSGDIVFVYEICNDECSEIKACSEARVQISIEGAKICEATNLITPNGDGINDNFTIPCLQNDGFPNNRITIFNQWGDEVYSAQPYRNEWQGTFNDEDLPVGTYFFILDLGTGQQPQDGFIQLER